MSSLRNASTVILLRDGDPGLEVFMVQRHIKSDFVGGAHVFPGGALDPRDEIDEALCVGHTDATASALLGIPSGGLAYWVAAIRECFEEAGVLLMYDGRGDVLDFAQPVIETRFKEYREALIRGEISFASLARREQLKLATDRVHYWAHWITPEGQPRRYDTRFFLTVAPQKQTAAHDGWELTDSSWITPRAALEKARTRQWIVILPTLRNLELLQEFRTSADAETAASVRHDVITILPRVVRNETGVRILLPGEEGFEEARFSNAASQDELLEGGLEKLEGNS